MADDFKMVYTPCQGYGCHEHCIISTFVDSNGVIDHTERMVLPKEIQEDEDPYGLGRRACICQKGAISGKIPYMEKRLRHPLKRVGERGEGKFEEISWDQALDEIATKLCEIRDEYGPGAVVINDFPCGYAGMPNTYAYSMQLRFMHAFGASSLEWEGIDMGVIRGPAIVFGDDTRSVYTDTQRVNNADYLIIWGGNPIGYTRAAHTTNSIMRLHEAGVKLTDIGVLFDSTAAKCDEFLQVKPASDTQLAFAMANYVIQSGNMDESFMLRKSVGPFLVRDDTGKFLRESDLSDDVEGAGSPQDRYVVWNQDTATPVLIARDEEIAPDSGVALRAEPTVGGIACHTAFDLLEEQLAPFTFEAQEARTGIPAAKAKEVIDGYIAHENAAIWLGAGLRYKNSTAQFRAIALVPMLTGKLENDACGFLIEGTQDSWPVSMNDFPTWLAGFPPKQCELVYMQKMLDSFEDPDYEGQQYKAYINLYSNPVHNWPPRELWEKRFFPNLDLVVVSEIRETETVKFADYVLPDLTTFERECICVQGGYMVLTEPAIEPVGEARDLGEVLVELAKRCGLGEYFPYDFDQWEQSRLDAPPEALGMPQDPSIANVEPKVTLERLRKEKIVKLADPGKMYHLFNDAPMNNETGRIEFYSNPLVGVPGGALAQDDPALIDNADRRKKYPLHLFIGRSRFFMQGQFREIPELRALSGNGPRVGMNPADAAARGISEGDLVEVSNERGTVKVPVHFTQLIQPGMAHLWYAYGVDDYKLSGPATVLGAYQNVEEAKDPVAEAWGPYYRQWRRGLGMPETLMMSSGEIANETIWDVLCEIRRAE